MDDAGVDRRVFVSPPALQTAAHAAICFHFVDNPNDFTAAVAGAARFPRPNGGTLGRCDVISSMELDLIAFKFQDESLIRSHLVHGDMDQDRPPERGPHWCAVDVILPDVIEYTSEGRKPALVSRGGNYKTWPKAPPAEGTERIECVARLARTYFRRSGIVVWNLILQRRPDGVLHEYDLIKLMHLYEGRSEGTTLREVARFSVRPYAEDEPHEVPLEGLLEAVWNRLSAGFEFADAFDAPFVHDSRNPSRRIPEAATIQLAMDANFGGKPVGDVLRVALAARSAGYARTGPPAVDGQGPDRHVMHQWIAAEPRHPVGIALKALAGVTNAIFDFEEVDEEEIMDTLDPTFHSGDSFIKVHRRSIVSVCDSDRPLEAVGEWLGMSPYLILPHCVILHNEELIDRVESSLNAFEDSRRVDELERLKDVCRKAMWTLYLPNIFNYPTEKTIYERAFELRGSAQKRQMNLDRMRELERTLEEAYERRRSGHDVVVQVLLLVLAVAQVLALFTSPSQIPQFPLLQAALGATALLTLGAIFIVKSRSRSRRALVRKIRFSWRRGRKLADRS